VNEGQGGEPRHVWAMGLCNGAYGFAYAVILVTTPQIMAAAGIGEPAIAAATALAGMMSLATFLVAPVLDTMISRRAWAVVLGGLAAVLSAVTLGVSPHGALIVPLLMAHALTCVMLTSALGGWLGAALPKSADDTVGTSFTVGNCVGFGLGALCQFPLVHALPAPLGQIAVGALVLVPLAVLPLIPTPDIGRKAVRESFGDLARDLAVLVRQPLVLRVVLMFAMPCAAFTLTNAFGGLGPDFHVSAATVDMANGFGATVIGMAASLLARLLLRRLAGPLLYLGIGVVGAAFTVIVIALPHTAPFYLLAVAGENAAQSIAQVAQNAIVFGSIRRGSPLAASQFGLLTTAAIVPYAYMQALDGYGYHLAGGVAGSFWMDAGVSLLACMILVQPVLAWMRAGLLRADDT
jgi:MFS transporter, PAT family, beta-lactamase induction signal transducer AmpG